MTTAIDTHPFVRGEGVAAWICECGKSRNSSAHGKVARPRHTDSPSPAWTVAASQVEHGQPVVTTDVVGTDFALPLVEPARRLHGGVVPSVLPRLRESGGTAVPFPDGSNNPPLDGDQRFLLVPPAVRPRGPGLA